MAEIDNASQICGGDRQAAQAISDVGDGDVRDVCETLRGFPSHAVKDLLSLGVCLRCILRLLGIRGELYDNCTLSLSSILSSVFGDLTDSEKHTINDASVENGKCSESPNLKELEVNEALCSLCLGILQFSYCDDKASVVRKDSAYDFASSIVELVKQEGHQIDGFSLEVSIPPVIQENEQSVCLYMKKKYESESWFQRKSLSERDSVKDALKTCMTKSLEKLLDCNSNMSTFRIRLTYTQAESSKMVQTFVERKQGCKRRKAVTGTDNDLETVDGIKVANFPSDEIAAVIESSLETCQDSGLSDRVSEPCQLVFHCCRTHIYFGGRYLKYSRNVSQTRWIIDDERMGDASVEELIGSNILPVCRGDSYKFHAAGREDIDVRMLGSGRPFLVEIQNGRHLPCDEDVKNIEEKINNLENKLVGVRNLKIMGSQGWTLMHEEAICCISVDFPPT
ncbi:putative tRNA pseudouridine synthase Pus10 isoform X2 [Morus notabilis]|uniref:putative tRNA pseudouridine synthase Pus10 isoform X2 n=1 Tax=Morus notabilis TaxID=981085 RepID=UPI000CED2D33|nr:putative tRNA pseudouridine synthase Pus10 isoform X2 [Morus notabilis]